MLIFHRASGKILLIFMLFGFTFVTMVSKPPEFLGIQI